MFTPPRARQELAHEPDRIRNAHARAVGTRHQRDAAERLHVHAARDDRRGAGVQEIVDAIENSIGSGRPARQGTPCEHRVEAKRKAFLARRPGSR